MVTQSCSRARPPPESRPSPRRTRDASLALRHAGRGVGTIHVRRNVTAERPMTATDRNLAHVNRRAETEPSVDRRLRCVQHRDRLAVIPYAFEVASQQPPGEAPAAMRRLHGDDRQTTGWNGVAHRGP